MFRSLCGEDIFGNVVLGTTKWELDVPHSELRHRELVAEYWKPLLDKGAKAVRIRDTASARKIIDGIIAPGAQKTVQEIVLQIQREMVDRKKIIPETQAGKELRFTLQEVLDIQKKLLRLDSLGDEDLQAQHQEAEEKVKLLVGQIQHLKIPLSRKLRSFLKKIF